jgi:hypothetical protein
MQKPQTRGLANRYSDRTTQATRTHNVYSEEIDFASAPGLIGDLRAVDEIAKPPGRPPPNPGGLRPFSNHAQTAGPSSCLPRSHPAPSWHWIGAARRVPDDHARHPVACAGGQ